MKKILTLAFVLVSCFAFSQKEKVDIKLDRKKDLVTVNGVEFFKYENKGSDLLVLSMTGEEIAYFSTVSYTDYTKVTESNPKGIVSYRIIKFEGVEEKTEITYMGPKGIAELFLMHNLYENNALNTDNVLKYIERNGRKYSDRLIR